MLKYISCHGLLSCRIQEDGVFRRRLVPPIVKPPYWAAGVSGFKDSLTLSSGFCASGIDPQKVEGLMGEEVKVWYDKEGDYIEVLFETKKGYFQETENDAVMKKIDEEGNIIGFSILKVSALKEQETLNISLSKQAA